MAGLGLRALGMSPGRSQGHPVSHSRETVIAIGPKGCTQGGPGPWAPLALPWPSLWPGLLSWPDSPWQLPCALSSAGPSVPSWLHPHPGYCPSQAQLGCLPGPLPALTHSLWSWPYPGPWFRPGVLGGGQPALLLRQAFQSCVGESWWLVQVEEAPQALVSQVATWGHHFARHAALPPAKQGQGAAG